MPGLLARLRRHPFPVTAWFDRVVAVSFAFPSEQLRPLLPGPLEVDAFEGLGFVTVAMVWTRGLRPAVLPRWLGQDFFLAGYRVFVKLRDERGRHLRGLKILRSETDKARMVWSGNLLTHYSYRKIELSETSEGRAQRVLTRHGGRVTLDLAFDAQSEPAAPPPGSPFPGWHAARRFAGPMPYTFDAEGDGRFVAIEGKRSEWTPRPIEVLSWHVGLFGEEGFPGRDPVLANAFLVEGVPYRWERGRMLTPHAPPEPGHA
jgi:hypothetical protein